MHSNLKGVNMDSAPRELSLAEIRSFMLQNNCKVTNHALVKHFRAFLTNKETQDEARKLFKSYVNTLASIKNDGAEKFLILRKKYVDECPSEDAVNLNIPMSPGSRSLTTVPSDGENSPFKNPPPYRPPPEVLDQVNPHPYQGSPRGSIALSRKNSSETCRSGSEYSFGSEFTGSDRKIGSAVVRSESGDSRLRSELARKQSVELYRFDSQEESAPAIPPRKRTSVDQTGGQLRQFSVEEKVSDPAKNVSVSASDSIESESNKENHIQQEEAAVVDGDGGAKPASSEQQLEENKLSVKEKMMKFNRFASEEEAKVPSPLGKKKPEKNYDDTLSTENLLQHPKAKEWLIAAANANYQELAKLSTDYPNLVKLQQLVATPISKTKPKKKLCTNPPVNLPSPVKSVVLEQGIADTVPTSEAQIFELGTTIAGDLPVKTITVPTVETGLDIPEVLRVDSTAPPFQPTFAGHDVSIIKVVLDCNEAASEECVDFEDKPLETAPDLNAVLVLQHRVAMLESEIGALRRDNAKLRSLNMRLQEILVERPNGTSFTEIPGFPDAKWLLSVSQNAQDSDYLFVKELVVRLFPLGVGNATVSGHPSNNPLGRGIKNGLEPDARTNVGRLDPVKVTYIRDRLYERRTILQDELGVAMQRSRKTAKHIAAVINNNPSLRTLRQE